MGARNLPSLVIRQAATRPLKNALGYKEAGVFRYDTWRRTSLHVRDTAFFLKTLGVQKGMKVAILSENRREWFWMDMAVLSLGGVTVPLYVTLAADEVRHVLSDSGARILVVSKQALLKPLEDVLRKLDQIWTVVLLDSDGEAREFASKPLRIFNQERKPADEAFEKLWHESLESIHREDLATVIYTSGTTGTPKGVMLTHGNFLANVEAVIRALPIRMQDIHLSFLPLCHVFERMCGHYLMTHQGTAIAYAESMDKVPENLREAKPTLVLAVPRFYEKIKARIEVQTATLTGLRKKLLNWAWRVSESTLEKRLRCAPLGLWDAFRWFWADALVFVKVKKALGGRVRYCVSGGAPLPKEIAEFFFKLGILVIEGYGLTETAPVIAANRVNAFKFGTVGKPMDNLEVKIASDGEILVRGESVMPGYYHMAEATREVIKDGWFHTGDLGVLDTEGFLAITGRKKEIIVTSSGKKVSTELVEQTFEREPLIARCVLFGEGKSFLTALIVPNWSRVSERATIEKIDFKSSEDLARMPWTRDLIQTCLNGVHKTLAPYEQIKYFHILSRDFSMEDGELTPTLKIKRRVIAQRYYSFLAAYYEEHERKRI